MADLESGHQQEQMPEQKPPEQENDLSIVNIDDFLQTANKKIENIFKDSPEIAKQLLNELDKKIQKIKEKFKDLSEDKSKALDKLDQKIRDDILKFDNKRNLEKL